MTTHQSSGNSFLSRRTVLLSAAAIGSSALLLSGAPGFSGATAQTLTEAIRPFRVAIEQSSVDDLRRRLAETRWPEVETVDDRSQGVQLAKLKSLVQHWGDGYDWRSAENRLNALPQFLTNIDDLDIHFIHVRSRHANALPLIMTHGWPGSVFEMLKVIGPLTDPTAHGGSADDAFHLVLPSIPGFGFSEKPSNKGWNPGRVATAWDTLMKRLGYASYVSQGGDWGAIISDAMGRQAPRGLLGIHVNRIERSTTIPPEIAKALRNGEPAPKGLSIEEHAIFDEAREFLNQGFGYAAIMGTRPQTIGYGVSDSPVGLAAWIYDKLADWVFTRGDPERALTKDEILDNISLYWFTNTGASSGRIYWENSTAKAKLSPIAIPAAVTVFPGEVYRPPKKWVQRGYSNLIYYNAVDKGGHFAAWEEPDLFTREIRAGFRTLR